ncbi:MAG: hypothetical protein JXR48_11110 [Candidatus Delongbacteria bacterium]|nr:hypothetical protein [Candidatus Delongbacteria bacterium]MBN2835501.1 hypothetical protein [Candidatus Delongbacteria bacterium]
MNKIIIVGTIFFLFISCITTEYFHRKYKGIDIHLVFKNIGTEKIEIAYVKFGKRKSYPTDLGKGGTRGEAFIFDYIPETYELHYKPKGKSEIVRKIKTPDDLPIESFDRDKCNIDINFYIDGENEKEEIIYEIFELKSYKRNGEYDRNPTVKIKYIQPKELIE